MVAASDASLGMDKTGMVTAKNVANKAKTTMTRINNFCCNTITGLRLCTASSGQVSVLIKIGIDRTEVSWWQELKKRIMPKLVGHCQRRLA